MYLLDSAFHSKEFLRVKYLEQQGGLKTFKDMEKLKVVLGETTGTRKKQVGSRRHHRCDDTNYQRTSTSTLF